MSAATMNTTHHGNYFGCCPPLQQQTPSCCTTSQSPQQQPSSSSSSSTCTTMISTHEALTQVPNTDISRLSFYLRCCVIGCGLANTDTIPMELLDFTSAHLLPQQYQHMICRLVFEDFSLGNLLNTIIYVDDDDNNNQQQVLLPPGIATMFVKPGTTEYALCMNQLQQLGSSNNNNNLPTFFNGNVMICTSEWLQSFHVQPFQRYLATMLNNTTSCTNFNNDQQQDLVNTAASLLLSMNNNNNDDHDQQQQHHDEEQQEQEDHQHNYKKVETKIQLDYYGHSDQDDMDIPMAAAVPLMDNESSSSSSSPAAASSSESMSGDYDDVSSSLITPGQQVRLFGLETEEMNNVIGYVSERKDNRVIVNVPNHSCKYSVRIENLMIIVQEAYCEIEE